MFQIAIIPNNTDANLSLCYKDKEKCNDVHNLIMPIVGKPNVLTLEDDYGNILTMFGSSIAYILYIDVAKSQEREFDQDVCVNKKREEFDKKLRDMGYMPRRVKKPQIIQ
jgi:hypothetical protein